MSRELKPLKEDGTYVDDNTTVGFDFINKEYYVKNMGTKTIAPSVHDAKLIFDIAAPGNIITEEEIEALSTTLETITTIMYTLEDNGRYIKTISFNDHDDLAIQYDEPFLFIRGSNEMWNMSSTIGLDSVSLFMWQYFVYYVGLDMNMVLMDAIINYFKKIQSPYVYNTIEQRTEDKKDEPLFYTNQIILNNADNSSRGEYTGTKNPENISNLNSYNIVSVSDNMIVCDTTPECDIGDIIQITTPTTFHCDNLIVARTVGNTIFTTEPITILGGSYEEVDSEQVYTPTSLDENDNAKVYIKAWGITNSGYTQEVEIKSALQIQSIQYVTNILQTNVTSVTEGNILNCASAPSVQVGDTIELSATFDTISKIYEDLHITDISGNDITIAETIPDAIVAANNAKICLANVCKVELMNYIDDTMYQTGETVYIQDNELSIYEVVPSVVGPSNVTKGYLYIKDIPLEYRNYQTLLGYDPLMLEVHNLTKVIENSFTLTAPLSVEKDDTIEIVNSGLADIDGIYTVDSVKDNKVYVVTDENKEVPEFDFNDANRPMIQFRIPSKRILLDMSYSRRADKVPLGQFMLDNNDQFTRYLELYYITPPTSQNYACFNQPVLTKYNLGDNLIYNAKNTAGHKIVSNVDALKTYVGSENEYAFVTSSSKTSTKYDRYIYVGPQTDTGGQTYQQWDPAPESTYMKLKGLYSDNYEDL